MYSQGELVALNLFINTVHISKPVNFSYTFISKAVYFTSNLLLKLYIIIDN